MRRGAAEQRHAADEGRLEAYGSALIGALIVDEGKVVRPSQLIASVRGTCWRDGVLTPLTLLPLTLTLGLSSQADASACSMPQCLTRISARVPVTVLELPAKDLAGAWSHGGGLSGSDLYLFEDLSYIYTEWADIMPRTIVHKGKWQIVGGVLLLTQDPDITWRDPRDRRYLLYRTKDAPRRLLLGLDFMLEIFEKLVREEPSHAADWLRLSSLKRERLWKAGEAEQLRTELMRCCWRPDYFAEHH